MIDREPIIKALSDAISSLENARFFLQHDPGEDYPERGGLAYDTYVRVGSAMRTLAEVLEQAVQE